jgi:hypothetical protein
VSVPLLEANHLSKRECKYVISRFVSHLGICPFIYICCTAGMSGGKLETEKVKPTEIDLVKPDNASTEDDD